MTEYIDGQEYEITIKAKYYHLHQGFHLGYGDIVDKSTVLASKPLLVLPTEPWSLVTFVATAESDSFGNPPFRGILVIDSLNDKRTWRNVESGGAIKTGVMDIVSVDRIGV